MVPPLLPRQACLKRGSFPPPELPGFDGSMTLSDFRRARSAETERRVLPGCDGSPRLTRNALPTCRSHYPGGPAECAHRLLPLPYGLPRTVSGSASTSPFRGLLRIHSRYGPQDRSAAQGDLCHEASTRPVAQASRSSASRLTDNYLGGLFLHRLYAPLGRTTVSG